MSKNPFIARRPELAAVEVTIGESSSADVPLDEAAIRRIIEFYGRVAPTGGGAGDDDMWSVLRQQHFGPLIELLETADVNALRDYLAELPRREAGHGSYQGQPAYDAAHKSGLGRSLNTLNALFGFAEAVGTMRPRSPEQTSTGSPDLDLATIVGDLDSAVGFPIVLPPVSTGLLGPIMGDGILHLRHLTAAYLAWRVRELARGPLETSVDQLHVCEIGGGAGLAAYYGLAAGVGRWMSVDLPEMGVIQAFNLMTLLGPDRVHLWGESSTPEHAVSIVSNNIHLDSPTKSDITINQDSLPEISRAEATRYVEALTTSTLWFLSINQEHEAPQTAAAKQLVVGDLADESGDLNRWYRMPFWLRIGYVEELYQVG
ncbi:MAG: hypothetical protein HKN94_04595 [Acidimicrobiales bacterium]|nr:hypothetical protein [Acidimicrobiales bacterium]